MNKKALKIFAIVTIVAFALIMQTGCGNQEPVSGSTDKYLDTLCEITIYDMSEKEAQDIINGAFDEIGHYEEILSRTIQGSDVDRINNASGEKTEVDEDTAKAIKAGLEAGDYSDGKFDITVGRITELWDFKSNNPKVPKMDELMAAAETVDYKQVKLDGNMVSLDNPEAKLDLGGIAKGYVADRITEYLEEQGVDSAIINLGGNVVVIGCKGDEKFTIGIERPYSDRTEIVGSVQAEDMTLVTSGIYERKFEKNGVLYHHILNPETGYPSDTDLEAVTITADKGNSCLCDGLSTSCLMAGTDGAMELVKKMQKKYPEKNIEASFIDRNDNMTKTKGMKIDSAK